MTARQRFLCHLLVIGALGVGTMVYAGPGSGFARQQLGGTFYVLAWIYLVLSIKPRWNVKRVCWSIFLLTCTVEFSQLWHPHFLEAFRGHITGQLLLGSTFAWTDFPLYALGLVIGLGVESHFHSPRALPSDRQQ